MRSQKRPCFGLVMGSQTLFERIISQEIPCHKVSEGENWFAFLDIYPRREGHTLVIPKRGVSNISQLSEKEISDLFIGMNTVQNIKPDITGLIPLRRRMSEREDQGPHKCKAWEE